MEKTIQDNILAHCMELALMPALLYSYRDGGVLYWIDPYFERYGVMHYSVANMPGAVPRTSTMALSNATLPYILKLAEKGVDALKEDAGFLAGLNTCKGHITCQGVSDALQLPYADPMELL